MLQSGGRLTLDEVSVEAEDNEGEAGREDSQIHSTHQGEQHTQENCHTEGGGGEVEG